MAVKSAARQNTELIAAENSLTRSFANKRNQAMSNADIRGRFIWHELLTTDTAAAAAFYPKVLPWRTQPSSMPGYTIWMAGQSQIGGLMALPADAAGTPPHWLIYIGTPSVDTTAEHAQRLGARVLKPAADIPNVGRFAVLSDPQGATFALYTPGPSGGGMPTPGPGVFSWHELATTDVAGALRFYGELFGWTKGPGHDMGAMGVYQIIERFGSQIGGMCSVQGPATPPSWLSYVNVADANRAVAAAKSAGARLLHGPVEVPGGSWIALFMDPQGGAFAVQEAPRAAAAKPAAPPPAKPAVAAPKSAASAPKPAVAAVAKPAAPAPKPAAAAPNPAPAAAPAAARPAAAKAPPRKAARKMRRAARKAARKTRRAGRKVARKARGAGRRVARKVRRIAGRRTARKVRRAARKVARKARRTTRKVARRVRRAGRRVARAARRRGR
jgi:predicted enzyme related to lactoylglutathione lyase